VSQPQNPMQEATSLVVILALLFGLGLFLAANNHVEVIEPSIWWLAAFIYSHVPQLSALNYGPLPLLVTCAFIGLVFFVIALPFVGLVARSFTSSGMDQVQKAGRDLQRSADKAKRKLRDKDKFIVR